FVTHQPIVTAGLPPSLRSAAGPLTLTAGWRQTEFRAVAGYVGLTIPASCASSPAWVRLAQPSLTSMRDTYPLTVASDRYSRLAIWAFDNPSPRQPSTSASRSVSVPTSLRACSRAGWLSVDAATRRRAAAGESTVCPSAATRTSPIRSAGGVDLTRNPAAPARSARSTYWSASKVVSTTTTGGSASLPIRSIAVRPSTP